MYRAKESFTTKNYDVKRKQILEDDFTTQDEINEFLNIGYIEVYDGSLEITENGTYNVEDYETANVDVAGGIDTSDATATADDILINKTAYVDGQKLTGTLPKYVNTESTGTVLGKSSWAVIGSVSGKRYNKYYVADNIGISLRFTEIANTVGLTAEKLKKDEEVMGITGTYEGTASKNIQYNYIDCYRDTGLISQSGLKLTVAKTGNYTVRYLATKDTSSGTYTTALYVNGTRLQSTVNSNWNTPAIRNLQDWSTNNTQINEFTGISLTEGDEIEVWVQTKGSTYWIHVYDLFIEEE